MLDECGVKLFKGRGEYRQPLYAYPNIIYKFDVLNNYSMKTLLMLIACLSISLTVLGQQEWTDTSFTNKSEATNKTVNGLKEGKWIEYYTVENGAAVQTDKKHATAYTLTIYKAGGAIHTKQFYMDGNIMTETIHRGNNIFLRFYAENGKVISELPPQGK
jgi:hypothetical protein